MIEALLLSVLGIGFFVISFDRMKDLYSLILERIKRWLNGFKSDLEPIENSHDKYWDHIKLVLKLSIGMGSNRSVVCFSSISALLGALTYVMLNGWISNFLVLMASITSFLLPYFILRTILQNIRVKSSREGEILLGELADNYKIHYYNMQQAIEITAQNIDGAPNTKRLLYNLSRGLNRVGTTEEIRHLIDEFELSINTSWSKILGNNMYFSLTKGIRVDLALDDLQKTITRARNLDELQKRQNNESKLILRYLVPASYLLTVFSAIKFFGLSFNKFMYYQFKTEAGLTWLTISLISYIISILSERFIAKSKLDF